MKVPCVVLCVVPLLVSLTPARTWTDTLGREIEAEMVKADSSSVVVKRGGKELILPLGKLSQEDKDYVTEWLDKHDASGKSPAAEGQGGSGQSPATEGPDESGRVADRSPKGKPGSAMQFDGKPLEPGGKMNVFEYPYAPEVLERVSKKLKGKDTGYKLAIAVPNDFDPAQPQQVFFACCAVNSADEGRSGNCGVFGMYAESCVANGWVCITYDSNLGRPDHETDLTESINKLKQQWPGISTWKIAVGGFSGGSKACFEPCTYLLKEKFNVVGAFLAGCNSDYSQKYRDKFRAPSSGYRKMKVFMSTGQTDGIATPASSQGVITSLKSNGMRNSKLELFEGGHEFSTAHFVAALKWFAEAAEK